MRLITSFTIAIIICMLLVQLACKKNDNIQNDNQKKIDYVVDTVRLGVEAKLGKVVPSLNIYIQTPDGSWFSSSAGEGYTTMTENTFFRFASNTKNFTSAAALIMQQDGWLNINDKITDTIPGGDIPYVPNTVEWDFPYKDQITIKMLLNHSAGVYDVDNDSVPGYAPYSYTQFTQYMEPNHQFTATEMVNQLIINNLFYFTPGEGKHYSNTGYAIAGEIIGRIYSYHEGAEKHLTDYLHDKLYGEVNPIPLEMHFPYLATDQDMPEPYACGHELSSNGDVNELCGYNMSAQVAEGNGYSTMKNLNTYIRTLLKAENVLTAESVDLMKNSVSTGDPNYGLGCFYKENLGYGHNGARVGNLTLMIYDPVYDVSFISYTNAIDENDFVTSIMSIYDVAYAAREALGYPGKIE